jgi:hypothetical protein
MVTIDIVDNYFDHYKRIKYDESNLAEPIEWYFNQKKWPDIHGN